jgi:hypothetical protein
MAESSSTASARISETDWAARWHTMLATYDVQDLPTTIRQVDELDADSLQLKCSPQVSHTRYNS